MFTDMEQKVIDAAITAGMKVVNGTSGSMYDVRNFKKTEGASIFYSEDAKTYIAEHFVVLPDGRRAALYTHLTQDADLAASYVTEVATSFYTHETESHIDTIDADNIAGLTNLTEKVLEDILSKWEGPGCGTDAIGKLRCHVTKKIREALEANREVIHSLYML